MQVAIGLEQRGFDFYRSLAADCGSAQMEALVSRLAGDEFKHLQTFKNMRNLLPAEQCGPLLTCEQLAEASEKFYKLILPDADEVRQIAAGGDLVEILEVAMQMEIDSIAYYSSLAPAGGIDTTVLKSLIQEEKTHLARLRGYRRRLGITGPSKPSAPQPD